MPTRDLTATDVAWCGCVDGPRRRSWAEAGRLKATPPFTEHDVLETAIAFSMTARGVSQKVATTAWGVLRPEVRKLLIAGHREPWLVISADGPRASACPDSATAAGTAAGLGRCWVVPTASAIAEAMQRLAELQQRPGRADQQGTSGSVRALR